MRGYRRSNDPARLCGAAGVVIVAVGLSSIALADDAATAPAPNTADTTATAPAAAAVPATIPAPSPVIPAALAAEMQTAINLLQTNQAADVIKLLADPVELQKHTNGLPIDQIGAAFAKSNRPAVLLAALRQAIVLPPAIAADGESATFTLVDGGGPIEHMLFTKSGDHWYLRD
jgi:hypothetical protein